MLDTMLNEQRDADQLGIDLDNFNINAEIKKYESLTIYGYKVLVRVYIPDTSYAIDKKGYKTSIIMPETAVNQHRYSTCTGLIVKLGPQAFKGESFDESTEWPKVGDWVLIPREGTGQFFFNGIPLQKINDILLDTKISDPRQFYK